MILLCCLPQANNILSRYFDKPQYCTLVIGCYMVAGDIFHLTIKMKGSLSSLVNKILLTRDTLCNEYNSTIIILWTFLSTSEEMLSNKIIAIINPRVAP